MRVRILNDGTSVRILVDGRTILIMSLSDWSKLLLGTEIKL